MRLFLAVKPDRPAEARLAQRVLAVQRALGDAASALRWMPATNIHATLHFLGEVAPARMPRLHAALEPAIAAAPFEIELGAVGAFPAAGALRVVWLDVAKGSAELGAVHAELGRRLKDAGFTLEPRPFSPHLTLARVPDRERSRVKSVRERLQRIPQDPIAWVADRVTLFRSDLSGPVPRYEDVQETLIHAT